MQKTILPLVSFAAIAIAVGVAHGLYSNRWNTSADLNERVERLDSVPMKLGEWVGTPEKLDEADMRRGGIKGHFSATYTNRVTNETVTMLIVCGRSGPISVHTPDVCYGGSGFKAIGEQFRKSIVVPGQKNQSVWALKFRAPATLGKSEIEVNWAWNGGSGWIAPESSRWRFAGYSSLYKLYVVRELSSMPSAKQHDPSVSFMQTFLPELEKILSPSS